MAITGDPPTRDTPWTVDATAESMLSIIREAVAEADHCKFPDPGCRECTLGTTPAKLDTGPCWYHRARALLAKVAP